MDIFCCVVAYMKNTFVLDRFAIEPILTNYPRFDTWTNNLYFTELHMHFLPVLVSTDIFLHYMSNINYFKIDPKFCL